MAGDRWEILIVSEGAQWLKLHALNIDIDCYLERARYFVPIFIVTWGEVTRPWSYITHIIYDRAAGIKDRLVSVTDHTNPYTHLFKHPLTP